MFCVPSTPRPRRSPRRTGFTLIELLTVMSIIIILLGITIAVEKGVVSSENKTKAGAEISALGTALDAFKAKYGDYPPASDTSDPNPETILIKALTGRARYEHLTGGVGQPTVVTFPGSKSIDMPTSSSDTTPVPYQSFIDLAKFTVNTVSDGVHTSTPVFLDPWGNAYLYRYKSFSDATNPSHQANFQPVWQNVGYFLVSRGPDGAPNSSSQIFDGSMETTGVVPSDYMTSSSGQNEDNITNFTNQ